MNQYTNQHTLFVCTLCRFPKPNCIASLPENQEQDGLNGGQRLINHLNQAFAMHNWGESIQLQPVRCMGSCSRSCIVAFAAPNKLTFIFSELSPTDSIPELLQFSQQYITQSNGNVPYKERPEVLKKGLVAVLPPLPTVVEQTVVKQTVVEQTVVEQSV